MGQLKEHLRIIYGEDVIKNLLIKGQKDEQLRSNEDILNALKNFGENNNYARTEKKKKTPESPITSQNETLRVNIVVI